jgi:hypothetical protein
MEFGGAAPPRRAALLRLVTGVRIFYISSSVDCGTKPGKRKMSGPQASGRAAHQGFPSCQLTTTETVIVRVIPPLSAISVTG